MVVPWANEGAFREPDGSYRLAIYLRADPSTAWKVYVGGDASEPPVRTLNLDEMKDYYNVHDEAEAKGAVLAWAEHGLTCE